MKYLFTESKFRLEYFKIYLRARYILDILEQKVSFQDIVSSIFTFKKSYLLCNFASKMLNLILFSRVSTIIHLEDDVFLKVCINFVEDSYFLLHIHFRVKIQLTS